MKSLPKQLLAAALLLGSVAAAGAWQGPTQAPPGGNAAAPLNVGAAAQSKQGTLGVGGLGVFGRGFLSASAGYALPANLTLGVNGAVGASQYCDAQGLNCVTTVGGAGATSTASSTSSAVPGKARAWATFRNIGGDASLVGEGYGVSGVRGASGVTNFLYYDTIVTFAEPILAGNYAVVVAPAFNGGSGLYNGAVLDWVCIWSKVSSSSIGVHCAYPGFGAYGNSIASVVVF